MNQEETVGQLEGFEAWRKSLLKSNMESVEKKGKMDAMPDRLQSLELLLEQSELAQTNRISEVDFARYFLTTFAGEEPEDITSRKLREWIDVAGGHGRYVYIVDNSNRILFLVPPRLDFNVIQPDGHDKQANLRDRLASAQNLMAINKGQAEVEYNHVLLHELERIVRNPVDLNHFVLWNKIFRHYGKPEIEIPGYDLRDHERHYDLQINGSATSDEPSTAKPGTVNHFDEEQTVDEDF